MASALNLFRGGAVGFIDWLGFGIQWVTIGLLREFCLRVWLLKSVNASVPLDAEAETKSGSHVILSRILCDVMPGVVGSDYVESARKLVALNGH